MIFSDFEMTARNAAYAFRLGMEAQGSEGLIVLIDALPAYLEAMPGDVSARLNQLLATMLAAQSRKDYLYLADLLVHELLTLLPRERQ